MVRNSLVRLVPVALLFATAAAGTAQASTDGSLGATSTGTVTINATIANRVQISGLRDVTLVPTTLAATISDNQDVCVWSNSPGRKYNIKASGSGTSGAFTLASGALPAIAYTVEWNKAVGQSSGTALTSGTALAAQDSLATVPTCGSTKSASLIVRMDAANQQAMQGGAAYTGVLTLVVAPE